MYSLSGSVEFVGSVRSVGTKGFQKREFWVKEYGDSKYPSIVPFVLKKDRCSLADDLSKGARVEVSFVLEGRVWDKRDGSAPRCFCDHVCLKLVRLDDASTAAQPEADYAGDGDSEEMPF